MTSVQQAQGSAAELGQRSAALLSNTRLWNSRLLSREEQTALAGAVSPAKSVGPNLDLVREAEFAESLFIICKGWACRYTTTRDGARQLTALLVPGDVGNLDSLMFDRLDYGVRTLTQTTVVTLPRDHASALAAKHPGIARMFIWLAMVENTILSKWVQSLGGRSAKERLAHLLCELSVRLAAEGGNESSFPFPLTQEVLGDALGLTAVHVNRTMRDLRARGMAMPENRTMTLPDVARLRRIGGFDPAYLHMEAPTRVAGVATGNLTTHL